jgi:putrescine importer
MSTSLDPAAGTTNGAQFRRVLGLPSLVLFGLAYMVPLTVWTTYGVVTTKTHGFLPAAYVVTTVAMLFTAYSYGRMVVAHPVAGSASRTRRARSAGRSASWSAGRCCSITCSCR